MMHIFSQQEVWKQPLLNAWQPSLLRVHLRGTQSSDLIPAVNSRPASAFSVLIFTCLALLTSLDTFPW